MIPMARFLMIACLICAIGAVALFVRPDPWALAEEKGAGDAALLSELTSQPDRIGWRLTEDLSLSRAILWKGNDGLHYPLTDGFTPLLYEFSQDEIRALTSKRSGLSGPIWEAFDISGRDLLHCRDVPDLCLIYDRGALERALDLRQGSLLIEGRQLDWRVLLAALAIIFGGAARWNLRATHQKTTAFTLQPERHSAMRGSVEIPLSARDLKLMMLLDARNGAVVTKDELYDAGWGRDFMPNSRALDQHIINLRRKLDPDKSRPVLIETVHGLGYRLKK
jgi:hypothetical protein